MKRRPPPLDPVTDTDTDTGIDTDADTESPPSDESTADTHALWIEHRDHLTRYATVLVGPHDAQDIAAIAFRRVVRQLDSGLSARNLSAYMIRSVTNAVTDQHRSQRRRQAREIQDALTAARPTSWVSEVDLDTRRAVAKLSVQQRAVIYFTFWEDLDSPQVAALLGIAPATVRRHLARARSVLRKELS